MPKVRELVSFEEVKEVIDINSIEDPRELVSKYVISDSMKNNLLGLVTQLRQNKHKSVNVVGDYGTGKSHLLAFISLILQKKDLRQFVSDAQVRKELQSLDREYAVVQFELPATQAVSLAAIFYDQLQDQLSKKYGIKIRPFDLEHEYDHKKYLGEVVAAVKERDSNLGLLVIIDEVSDFMKQRQKHDMNFDLQFLRQVGEVSQSIDFLYVGSMQEHVFTSPKYVEQADVISRVSQRFTDITITKEDIQRVVGNRVVRKTGEQMETLRRLFKGLLPYFENLNTDEETYLLLYPVHPQVIQIFKELPFFEHRGIISFVVEEVKRSLDAEFPTFVTYDKIFDLISRTHAIKNLEEVRPVVDTVNTLDSKIELLDQRFRADARKMVRALAVLYLARATGKNGASAKELAETLFITPESGILEAADNVQRILKRLRDVTSGQFVNRTEEGIFSLDLERHVDFDFKIQQVADYNLPQGAEEEEFRQLLIDKLALSPSGGSTIFDDTSMWPSRNSFRMGWFIIETRATDPASLSSRDYEFHILSNYRDKTAFKQTEGLAVLNPNFDDETIRSLKKLAAIDQLIGENWHKDVMLERRDQAYRECSEKLKQCLADRGTIEFKGVSNVSSFSLNAPNLDALVSGIKSSVFEDYFQKLYPKYPTFGQKLSAQNISGTISSVIRDIVSKGLSDLGVQSLNALKSLDLVAGKNVETPRSEFAKVITEFVAKSHGKNVPIEDIVNQLAGPPYGLQKEIAYLVLSVLLFNGEIVFVEKGGKRIYANDFSEVFKRELAYFEEVRYVLPEEEVPIPYVVTIFEALRLQSGLVRNRKTWPEALKEYREAVSTLRNDVEETKDIFSRLGDDGFLPLDELRNRISEIESLPIEQLDKVKNNLADFRRLNLTEDEVKSLHTRSDTLQSLLAALRDYQKELRSGMRYMEEATSLLGKYPSVFPVKDSSEIANIFEESKKSVNDIQKLLSEEDRRPIRGKIQQFRRAYVRSYFTTHEKAVGKSAAWIQLDDLRNSKQYRRLQRLGELRCVNNSPFLELALGISQANDRRCNVLTAEDLDLVPSCRNCHFPEGSPPSSIESLVAELSSRVNEIEKIWERQIVSETKKNQDQVKLLPKEEQSIISEILKDMKIPEQVTDSTIRSLNNLFERLKIVDVNVEELFGYLTKESDVLTLDELAQKFEQFKDEKLAGSERRLVRFRIRRGSTERPSETV